MGAGIQYFLHSLGVTHEVLFWLIWCPLTLVASVVAARLMRHAAHRETAPPSGPQSSPFKWSPRDALLLASLALVLGAYIATILVWEDFTWYDDSFLTAYSLRGSNLHAPIWPELGRFFPLALQEFNLIRHFTTTVSGYYSLQIAQLLVLASVIFILDDRMSTAQRVMLTALVVFTPTFVVSFSGLTYPERNILFLLGCLALFIKSFERTHAVIWAVAAVVSAQLMLYLKEPVFALLLCFAAARLILRSWTPNPARWNFAHLRGPESLLDLCLAAVSLSYLAIYVVMRFPHATSQDLACCRASFREVILYYLRVDALAWVFAVVVAVRAYSIFRGRTEPHLLWDGLACGGVVYMAAYLVLRMTNTYYMAPVDLIAVPYLGRLLFSSWRGMRPLVRVAIAALAVVLVCQNLELSALRLLERKLIVRQKAAIASVILEKYRRDPGAVRELYFPFANLYVLSEFAAHLRYRGLPLEEEGDGGEGKSGVEIFSRKVPTLKRCLPWRLFVCHPGGADAGSLVIVLPDDPVDPPDRLSYQQEEEKLLSYDPNEQTAHWLVRMVDVLRRLPK